jgi:cation diffusion facilitator family transporter
MEDLAALVQSCIIIGTGIFIIYKSINKFIQKETISYSGIDLGIMILSLIFSFFISRTLKKTGDRTESNTLKADALHYQSDLYSNSAAILAIILTFYTGITFFDLLFAIVTGIIIIVSAIKILTKGVSGLLDTSIPKNVENKISDIIRNIPYPVVGYHKLRSRLSGNRKYIDFHLLICRIIIIDEAHALATGVESKIKKEIPRIDITIHIEPCPYECDMTENTCVARRHIPGGG